MLKNPRSGGQFLLTEQRCEPQYGHNYFDTVIPDRCPGFVVIATAEDEASYFLCPGSHLHGLYTAVEKLALANTLLMELVIIPVFPQSVERGHLQHARAG